MYLSVLSPLRRAMWSWPVSVVVTGAMIATLAIAPAATAAGAGTRIETELRLERAACAITITGGDRSLCEDTPALFTAVVTCPPGYAAARAPEWFLDGASLGRAATIGFPASPPGTHILAASCGSCVDQVTVTVLPLAACTFRASLTAAYADSTLLGTSGIFIAPGIAPVTPANFPELRFLMRPVTIAADMTPSDRADPAARVIVETAGPRLELYRGDGARAALPETLAAAALPVTRYLNATAVGPALLVARGESAAGASLPDTIRVRAGVFPGLAGKSLSGYPYFEFVRATNSNDVLKTAVDPVRHAERVGLTCRVYVVAHRTPPEWAASNTLVDVTGGFELATVGAGSIASNVVTAWPSGLDGGVLGRGYDVVYDFGRDGRLDPGDLVDGLDYGEPGITVMPDITRSGPHAVSEILYSGGYMRDEDTYYPGDIASLGRVPLVVVSHGMGHNYQWYDYIGYHLASYGYVVMSHSDNIVPGIEDGATSVLDNIDWFLGALGSIGGGVLDGHVDASRIASIGHSRGGNAVVRAYAKLCEGSYLPAHFGRDSVRVVSAIAPVVYLTAAQDDLRGQNFHLIWGAADGDVSGAPDCAVCMSFRHSENAAGNVQVSYIQGVNHEFFNCCGADEGVGPDRISRADTQALARAYFLALVELYLRNNLAMKDCFTRMYEDFHPAGIAPYIISTNQYRDGAGAGNAVVDDYQSEPSPSVSSSGGAVTWDVHNLSEGFLNGDADFTFTPVDPMNGMTMAEAADDLGKAVVFDWSDGESRQYQLDLVPALRDVTGERFLSFRACQGTRHPETLLLNGPLSFTVTLADGSGRSSSIPIASFGTITRPYQRTGYGGNAGWQNEFETVRIRLADFEADGSGIDLRDLRAIRFQFGAAWGSARGRLGLDQIEFTRD